MTESELLAALQELTDSTAPERDGYHTTAEVAKTLVDLTGASADAAVRRVRKMWLAARAQGRLEERRIPAMALGGTMKMTEAYRLKESNDV